MGGRCLTTFKIVYRKNFRWKRERMRPNLMTRLELIGQSILGLSPLMLLKPEDEDEHQYPRKRKEICVEEICDRKPKKHCPVS